MPRFLSFLASLFLAGALLPAAAAGIRTPRGDLTPDGLGNFFGATKEGGASGAGTLFRVSPFGELTVLLQFTPAQGSEPNGALFRAGDGQLWGTTHGGGANAQGTLFRFAPATGTLTTVASFDGPLGSRPVGGLVADNLGFLWGVCSAGGSKGLGTVFKVPVAGGAPVRVVDFTNFPIDGHSPAAGLLLAPDGLLYGTTAAGGAGEVGTVFRIDPATGAYTTLASFTGNSGPAQGSAPAAPLTAGADGLLYGSAREGGAQNLGTIFRVDPAQGTLASLFSFDGTNGAHPEARFLLLPDGLLWSSTRTGGEAGVGKLYSFHPGAAGGNAAPDPNAISNGQNNESYLSVLPSFTGTAGAQPGAFPVGGLVADAQGRLLGTTAEGGSENMGTIFRYDPASGAFVLLTEPTDLATPPGTTTERPVSSGPAGLPITITGTTRDNVAVFNVVVSLNGGAYVPATLRPAATAGGAVTWTVNLQPVNGDNVLLVKAIDNGGTPSTLTTIKFKYQAFLPQAGTYLGLATPAAALPNPAAFAGQLNVRLLGTGRFTGTLLLAGLPAPVALSGQLDPSGKLLFGRTPGPTLTIAPRGQAPLTLALTANVDSNVLSHLTGAISQNGAVVANLAADQLLYTSSARPQPPFTNVPLALLNPLTDRGRYTVLLPAAAPAAAGRDMSTYPQGTGYATLTVAATGAVRVAGKLADGTVLSASSSVSRNLLLPLFVRLAGGGVLAGPVQFRDQAGLSDADSDALTWYKPAQARATLYPAGWPAGLPQPLLAARYVTPPAGTTLLGTPPSAGAENARFLLSHPVQGPLTNGLSINALNRVTPLGPPAGANGVTGLTLSLAAGGLFTGTYVDPVLKRANPFAGAILQKSGRAEGYTLAPNSNPATTARVSALVTLQPSAAAAQ